LLRRSASSQRHYLEKQSNGVRLFYSLFPKLFAKFYIDFCNLFTKEPKNFKTHYFIKILFQ